MPGLANGSRQKRRHLKVVVHSSPFLRCIQTATALSAGIASDPSPLLSPDGGSRPIEISSPVNQKATPRARPIARSETPPQDEASESALLDTEEGPPHPKTLLRLDAFLGEWMTPSYFEHITPPPDSIMMVASAKAELLRKELYSTYPHFQTHIHAASSSVPRQLWGSVPRSKMLAQRDTTRESLGSCSQDGVAGLAASFSKLDGGSCNPGRSHQAQYWGLPGLAPETRGYAAPIPTFAVSSKAPIPSGYVSHARDACVDIDYQWDSMREPFAWGDGGEYGEEWAAMHRRFRLGIQRLVGWYSSAEHPTNTVKRTVPCGASSTAEDAGSDSDNTEDAETETVVILVTHGAGCNALIGAITHQPVLADAAMGSLTMAVRKPGNGAMPDATEKKVAEDDTTSQSAASTKGMTSIHEYYDLKILANTDHFRSPSSTPGGSRSSSMANVMASFRGRHANSLSSALGSPLYAGDGASRSSSLSAVFGAPRHESGRSVMSVATGGVAFGSDTTSINSPSSQHTPSTGLWSPVARQGDTASASDSRDTPLLLDFGHEKTGASKMADSMKDTRDTGRIASPDVMDESEKRDEFPQLGLGAGGLWGSPQPLSELGQLLGSHKRRWSVNERA